VRGAPTGQLTGSENPICVCTGGSSSHNKAQGRLRETRTALLQIPWFLQAAPVASPPDSHICVVLSHTTSPMHSVE
jgi:hypothetical protein